MSYDPFIGEIILFAGFFVPRGWARCDGQLLAISQNTALFSLLGTTYGGDGRTNFALPDLRGRVPIGPGQGPRLANYQLGAQGGEATVTLSPPQIPVHNHPVAKTTKAEGAGSSGDSFVVGAASDEGSGMSGHAGGSQPHNNMQPFTVLNYIIALEGVYPSRD